jgi:hypothetical protein
VIHLEFEPYAGACHDRKLDVLVKLVAQEFLLLQPVGPGDGAKIGKGDDEQFYVLVPEVENEGSAA